MRRFHSLPVARVLMPVLALVSLFASPAPAAIRVYHCILNPRQEVPPIMSSAMGGGRFVIDTDANTVTYRIAYTGLTGVESGAHIHGFSAPGVSAGVKVALPAGNPKVGVWNYVEGDEAGILAGLTYANVHTSFAGGGEIRGQIVPFNALIDAAQEVPTNPSLAKGWATATIDTALDQLTYYISYQGIVNESAAHIHGNALHGTGTGVKHTLPNSTFNPKIGTWSYAAADEAAILEGRTYVNIHTTANPGGEIRGQLVPLVIPMDSEQQVPPTGVLTSAGFAMAAIDTASNILSYDVRVLMVSPNETAAHIHGFAASGTNAGVLQPLSLGPQKVGTWAYGAANEGEVLSGRTYFNVHTNANPGGEIRGQIENVPGAGALLGVGGTPRSVTGLAAAPNPSAGRTRLTFQLTRTGAVSLAIVGVDGRAVRSIPASTFAPGNHTYEWDGRDDDGRAVAPGVYFAIARTLEGDQVTRLARLR